MNRNDWEFEYTAKVLAEAAKKKADFRESRTKWWLEQKEKVMKTIRESGIEVTESVADKYSNTSSGHGPQIVVDNTLQKKLNECFLKIKEHDHAAREYRGWVQVLTANPENRVKLLISDWLFFFGDEVKIKNAE